MALKAWGVCLRLLFLLVRDVHITLAFLTVVLCLATWKFLKVTVWPASESSTIKLVNYGNYLGTGTVSDCWRSSPSFGQSLEGCAALLRLSWHLGDWPGVGEPWLLAGDEVWGNLGRGTRKLHTCGVAMDTVGHCAKVIQRNAQFRVQIDYCSFFWANLVISPDLTWAGRYSTEKSADQAGFLSFLALCIVQSVRESKEKHWDWLPLWWLVGYVGDVGGTYTYTGMAELHHSWAPPDGSPHDIIEHDMLSHLSGFHEENSGEGHWAYQELLQAHNRQFCWNGLALCQSLRHWGP